MDRSDYIDIRDAEHVPSFHDAELVCIEHHPDKAELELSFRRVCGELEILRFTKVTAQRIVDFSEQNVVSRLLISPQYRFSAAEVQTWVQWVNGRQDSTPMSVADEQAEQHAQDFRAGRFTLFVLEPSCGAEMAVLCEAVWIRQGDRP